MADGVTERARAAAVGWGAVQAGLIGFAAVAPLMPTNDLKVDFTLLSALLSLVGLYGLWRGGIRASRSRLDLPLVAFLLAMALATLLAPRPFLSFFPSRSRGDGFLTYVAYLLMAWTATRLPPQRLQPVLKVIVASAALIGAIGLAQYYGADPLGWVGFRPVDPAAFFGVIPDPSRGRPYFGWRAFATLGNPVFLGGYTLLLIPVLLAALLTSSEARARRSFLLGILALVYGALVASGTRAAFAGFVLAVLVLVVRPPRHPMPRKPALGVGACLGALTILLTLTGPGGELVGRTTGDLGTDNSLRMKLFVWKHILPLIADRPLFGWGLSSLAGRLPGLGSREYFELYGFALSGIDTAHNEVLHIAFSAGLFGLAAYLWIWLVVLRSLLATVRAGGEAQRVGTGLLAGLAGYALWLQSAWSHIGPANVFWTVAGLALSVRHLPGGEHTSQGGAGAHDGTPGWGGGP
ncbi:MAG: O-antigen ligase family protein [Armatimonadota bacterium]|nr:O-antigen ligase family protein [Armatimonadota bacterium]MDR7480136.1 O-antigen ligase family protein [Armatimonadota bacterium]MDR7488887.1 O-antigen ligase family protein [Armatimonadota bacterium]MDR7490349.1 O-antigen ligase family protein [Armatimonadota bacterium]MDR7501382.1 O-antigen ligase family protein [Armatimonadota bacterium]